MFIMNIWIINPFDPLPGEPFRPGRYTFIAKLLAHRGHSVLWWTSDFFHTSKSFRRLQETEEERSKSFSIRTIHTPKYKKNIGVARLVNHFLFGRRFFEKAKQEKEAPDIILASFPPIGAAGAAIRLARLHKSKVVIDIQDLWPEVFLNVFPKYLRSFAKSALNGLSRKADNVFRDSDALVAVSKEYLNRGLAVCDEEKPSLVLPLGVDLQLFDDALQSECHLLGISEDQAVITYIGSLGKTYDMATIVKAAEYFKDDRHVVFAIAGDGFEREHFQGVAEEKRLRNVLFLGMLTYGDVVALLRRSSVGLNAYACGATQSWTNKIFEYFAAGLPVVNSLEGDARRLIETEDVGVQYAAGDAESLVSAIQQLLKRTDLLQRMGRKARCLAEVRFDRHVCYPALESFLLNLLGK